MRYLTLEKIKKQCNIDEWYNGDNEYLISLGNVAENIVETDLDDSLESIVQQNDGVMPESIIHSMLLMIAHLYQNREAVTYGSSVELPLGYEHLLCKFKNYKNFNG